MTTSRSGSAMLRSARSAARPVELLGAVGALSFQSVLDVFRPPTEFQYFLAQIEEIGWRSLPLILASGFAVGVVMTLHTRSTLVQFGAEALIPTFQAVAFFSELGPLLTGLLVAGRVGAGIGAELANMRATEQIDAIESLSIDSFQVPPGAAGCGLHPCASAANRLHRLRWDRRRLSRSTRHRTHHFGFIWIAPSPT